MVIYCAQVFETECPE